MGKKRKKFKKNKANDWMRKRFPGVIADKEDTFLLRRTGTAATLSPFKVAMCLGEEGSPNAPIRFARESNRFYAYSPNEGIYEDLSEEEVRDRLYQILEECAKAVGPEHEKAPRSMQSPTHSSQVTSALKGRTRFPDPARNRDLRYVHVQNGVVDLETLRLRDFSPSLPSAWKLPVPWLDDPPNPPRFWDLMGRLFPEADDRDLAIEVLASAFLGNPFQRIVLLSGAPATGKSSLARILSELLGPGASGLLQFDQLKERFTPLSWAGRLLLIEPEVEQADLNKGIRALKAISGHDPMVGDRKWAPDLTHFTPRALPLLVTNNRVWFNGGSSRKALQRRLMAFDVPEPPIPLEVDIDFVDNLLKEEGPAILRILLSEAHRLQHGKALRPLTATQLARNAGFLGIGDELLGWAQDHVSPVKGSAVPRDVAIESARVWLEQHEMSVPSTPTAWSRRLKPVMESMGGTWSQSLEGSGKGWRGVALT